MITVAVAARDSAASRYYRGLLADAKFEAIFSPDVDSLIRHVKSRPIDLIIFDLNSPSIRVTAWLEAVKRDADLALTPVLWVGHARPMALAVTLDNYRPGARISEKPTLKTLMELVSQMVGRLEQRPQTVANRSNGSSRPWKPGDETIDHALSIFAESQGQSGHSPLRPDADVAGHDQEDEDDWKTAEIRRSTTNNHPNPVSGTMDAAVPNILNPPLESGPKAEVIIDFPLDQPQTSGSSATRLHDESALTATIATSQPEPISEAFIDEVTNRVISRLAVEVFKNLDKDAVRQAVRDVLSEIE